MNCYLNAMIAYNYVQFDAALYPDADYENMFCC